MLTRSTRRLITAVALTLAALAASTSSAQALDTSAPVLTPREVTDFSVTYDVEISASSNKARTRWQAVLKVKDGEGKDRPGVNYTDWSTDQEDRWTWVGGQLTLYPGESYTVWAEWNVYNLCLGNPECIDNGNSPSTGLKVPKNLRKAKLCKRVPGCVDRTTKRKKDDPPIADAGGPYTVVRGKNVPLDGSASEGKIKSYEWTFLPAPEPDPVEGEDAVEKPFCEKPRTDGKKKGKTAKAVILCDVTAILTVTDNKGRTDSDFAKVTVKARDFKKIPFTHQAKAKKLKGKFAVSSRACLGGCVLGRNVPTAYASKPEKSPGWFIEGGEPDKPGWTPKEVKDKGGPFDGYHYVGSHQLKIDRTSLVQAELWPGSATRKANAAANRGRSAADQYTPGKVFDSVLAHEKIHSDLIREKLDEIQGDPKTDPVPFLEGSVREDEKLLVASGNSPILTANQAIGEYALPHAQVQTRLEALGFGVPALMLAPTGAKNEFDEWYIGNLALAGDDG